MAVRPARRGAPKIAEGETWVSEGAYLTWTRFLFENADLVIWVDIPWRVASFRILVRHVKAELAKSNRFPGWRGLYRFWRWSSRCYNDRNPPGFQMEYGIPNTRSVAAEWLQAYRDKLLVCRTKANIEGLFKRLVQARDE